MQSHMTADLVCEAVRMGMDNRHLSSDLIHHSDRGSQYTSCDLQELLVRHQIRPSIGRTGDCYDNAVMVSFIATLKRECVDQWIFESRHQAKTEVFNYIEVFYNRQRLHATLVYHFH